MELQHQTQTINCSSYVFAIPERNGDDGSVVGQETISATDQYRHKDGDGSDRHERRRNG